MRKSSATNTIIKPVQISSGIILVLRYLFMLKFGCNYLKISKFNVSSYNDNVKRKFV